MRPTLSVPRTAVALLAALLVSVVAAPTAVLAHHPTFMQRFRADSGDRCQYGYTEGSLAFRAVHPPELPAVDISGVVADRPMTTEPSVCPDDYRWTVAYFTAYALDLIVDRQARRVDNGTLDFRLTLGVANSTVARIDRVTVEVCRISFAGSEPTYCGRPQTFWPYPVTPQH